MPVSQVLPDGPFTPNAGTPGPDVADLVAFLQQKGTATDTEVQAAAVMQAGTAASATYVPLAAKGAANGVASLGADSKVPAAQLPASTTVSDASPTVKGIVQLAGDLAGTAALPTVPGLAAKAANSGVPGYQTWNGTAWSTRPTGFRFIEAFSDGTAGSTKDTAAPIPAGAVDGDRWWKALA